MNDSQAVRGLARTLADPALFSAHILGRPLREYQAAVARAILQSIEEHAGRQFTVLFPRQAGKNELSAHVEAFLLARYQLVGASLVKAAPTFKPQTLNSLSRLAGLLDTPLTCGRWVRSHGYIVRLGKSTAIFFSAEPTANVVGATADTLLECDEAQDVHPEARPPPRPSSSPAPRPDARRTRLTPHSLDVDTGERGCFSTRSVCLPVNVTNVD